MDIYSICKWIQQFFRVNNKNSFIYRDVNTFIIDLLHVTYYVVCSIGRDTLLFRDINPLRFIIIYEIMKQ